MTVREVIEKYKTEFNVFLMIFISNLSEKGLCQDCKKVVREVLKEEI